MSKLLLIRSLGALYGSSALFSFGAGGYLLAAREPIKSVEESGHPLISFHRALGGWERTQEFAEARFYFRCSGNGHWGGSDCIRFMRVENQGSGEDRIFLFVGEPTQGEKDWPIYKFIYKEELEEGVKEYRGQCKKDGKEDEPDYLCSENNLPRGWTKEFVKDLV